MCVRKHRAPNGALRPTGTARCMDRQGTCQKAPSAKRCIKTRFQRVPQLNRRHKVRKHRAPNGALRRCGAELIAVHRFAGQKAPSAKRCIKTRQTRARNSSATTPVRKHRAPKGTLRPCTAGRSPTGSHNARKHRAPNGVLRPPAWGRTNRATASASESTERQTVH